MFKNLPKNLLVPELIWRMGLVGLILPFLFIYHETSAQQKAFSLEINGLVKDDDNGRTLEGATVKLMKGSQVVQSIVTTGNGKFKFVIEPNQDLTIKASKPGYTGKIVAVSTKDVVQGTSSIDFYKFPISISIFKEIPGLDVSVLNNPIGAIFYNQTMMDFDYTADKFLRPELEKLKEEMEKKKKEELERQKQELENQKDKLKAEQEAKLKAEQDAKKNLEDEAKRKAREAREAEEAKNKAASDALKMAEEEKKRKAREAQEEALALKRKAEEEAKAKAAREAEEELKKREEARKKLEEDAKLRSAEKQAELERKKAALEAKRKTQEEAQRIYVKAINYETEEGTNFIITKTTITLTDNTIVNYKKIVFAWGGIYYKKDESDITPLSFNTDLKNYVVKTD